MMTQGAPLGRNFHKVGTSLRAFELGLEVTA